MSRRHKIEIGEIVEKKKLCEIEKYINVNAEKYKHRQSLNKHKKNVL